MIIFHIITCLNNGGAEAVLYRLVTADKNNTHIVLSLMDEGKYGALLVREGLQVFTLNMPSGRVTISGLFQLYKIVRDLKPDIVQTWMYHADLVGGIVSRVAGVKRVIWGIRHTDLDKQKTSRKTRLVGKICAWLSRYVPYKIICNSNKAIETHNSLGYQTRDFVIIPNGYSADSFYPDKELEIRIISELQIQSDIHILGMVARYNPLKDHENLIYALDMLKRRNVSFKCLLVGREIDERNISLNVFIDEYGLNNAIFLLGQRDDIPSIMNALDLHILSSSSEAFPNVIAEAMACGTPCVTTDVGDAALIVGDTGWVVPPRDPQKLADAIIKAIDEKTTEPEKWNQRKINCRRRIVDNFSLDKMVAAFEKVWSDACDVKS